MRKNENKHILFFRINKNTLEKLKNIGKKFSGSRKVYLFLSKKNRKVRILFFSKVSKKIFFFQEEKE